MGMSKQNEGPMYGRVLRDTSLQVAYRRRAEDLTTPFKCKGILPSNKEIEIEAKLPNGSDVPGKERDIIPCGRDNKLVEYTSPAGKRMILSDQDNIVRVFVFGPDNKKSAIYIVNNPEKYTANMIESSPNSRMSVAEYDQKLLKLLDNPPYCAEDIEVEEDLSGLTEDIDLNGLDVESAVDDIEIDVFETQFHDPASLDAILLEHYSGRWDIHLIPQEDDDTELYIPPIDPRREEVLELTEEVKGVDEKIGGLRKMDLVNEDGISEKHSYEAVKTAMAACMAVNLDELMDAQDYRRFVVLCKEHAFDMPRHTYFHDGELSDEEEDNVIGMLYNCPAINEVKVNERYRMEQAIIGIGKRLMQMLDFVENNKEQFFVYEGNSVSPAEVISFVEGDIAVYSADQGIVDDLVERSFKCSKRPDEFHSDKGLCRLSLDGRDVYFLGRHMKEKFEERADQAHLERYMLEANIDGDIPALPPRPETPEDGIATVTRIMMQAREEESAGALDLVAGAARKKEKTEEDISELLRDECIQEIIMLTEKGTNDRYEGEHASGEEEFMRTLFPDGKEIDVGGAKIDPRKVIVLQHYKLKIKNGNKAR